MTTTLKVAAVPTADTPGFSIYLHNDKRSYIFGRVSEGTQRAYNSRKISFSGTEHVFLTGAVEWTQLGGLFGLLLSLGGQLEATSANHDQVNTERMQKGLKPHRIQKKSDGVQVHGGDNLSHVLAASRAAIYRQPIRVGVHETRKDPRADDPTNLKPDWEDDAVRVWKIPMRRARSTSARKRRHDDPEGANETADDDTEEVLKPRITTSDPELARLLVEKTIFSGKLANHVTLVSRKLRDLKPEDQAFVPRNMTMERYRGPFATKGEELEDPDGVAYVFSDSKTTPPEPAENGDEGDGIELRSVSLPRTGYSETAMSYIVKCQDQRGKFNAPAAKALGVRVMDFKLLTAGQSVTAADGTVVTPDMVLGAAQRGNGFIVADIPSRDFLDAFLERAEWSSTDLMSNIVVMYWNFPTGLASDPRVQKFVEDHAEIKHVFCAEDTCPNMVSNPGPAELQVKLRRIDPERFPLLKFDNTVKFPAPPAGSPIELGRAESSMMLMPRVMFDTNAPAPFPDLVTAANSLHDGILRLAQQAKAKATDPSFLERIEEEEKDIPNRDTEIIALGTGSSMPSKYRNVSGTLIRVPGIGNYLLDAGEATIGQIRRLFDPEDVADTLRNLRCIVISHLHADHHMGVPSVIKAWYEQALLDGRNDATLAISCIQRYRHFLEEVSQIEDFGFHRLRFPHCPVGSHKEALAVTAADLGEHDHGLASIQRVPVPHCYRSHGTQLELTSGLRIAYSGDCRPSTRFADAFHGAHLLVHECTFGDDMASHAKAKSHSTMSEALDVARRMGARRTLLTHFSQRYIKSESLSAGEDGAGDVLLAYDFMRVRLGDFQKAACYLPAVQRLLLDSDEELRETVKKG